MDIDNLISSSYAKKFMKNLKPYKPELDVILRVDDFNEDILKFYQFVIKFAFLTDLNYFFLKLEDTHYFSENNQFGTQIRQVKGGAIKAFQENMQQLIQLIKVHLIPLLEEVKKSSFYYDWMKQIEDNDTIIQDLLYYYKKENNNIKDLNGFLLEMKKNKDKKFQGYDYDSLNRLIKQRDEAISHIKDKWVSEVEGGKMWQIQKSQSEQGLDYVLLPNLFFGINLQDPLQVHKTLKEQLDEDIYTIDVTTQAKEQVARHMYKFYIWLKTAIIDTKTTFKIKISALRQFYSQIQMQINFMKPLLLEIVKKTEGFGKFDIYSNFEDLNPEIVSMLEVSTQFIRLMGIIDFKRTSTQGGHFATKFNHDISDLMKFSSLGLYINKNEDKSEKGEIVEGPYENKSGFIGKRVSLYKNKNDKKKNAPKLDFYEFYPIDKKFEDININDINELKKNVKYVLCDHLKSYSFFDWTFDSRRYQVQEPNSKQYLPYIENRLYLKTGRYNIMELALYKEKLRDQSLEILESFVDEIKVIKDDLVKYFNYFEENYDSNNQEEKEREELEKREERKKSRLENLEKTKKKDKEKEIDSDILNDSNYKKAKHFVKGEKHIENEDNSNIQNVKILWKVYRILKVAFGHISYAETY